MHVQGSALGEVDLGRVWALPPTLTPQFHPFPQARVSPYVGGGINYTFFYSEGGSRTPPVEKVDVKNSWGWALNAGVDIEVAPEVQVRIGRPQPADMVRLGVERLRRAGIAGINLDLMYGLPAQTVAHVEANARFAAKLRVPRIAVFGYAHVAWMKPHQKAIDASLLPGTSARMEQAEAAEAVLRAAGYVALGLDHLALPDDPLAIAAAEGRLRRNFQGYTTDTASALLGLGASSTGSLPGGFAQNIADERRYAEAVAAGRLPVARGIATTAEDRLRAGLIERLMSDFSLDLCQVPDTMLVDALARLGPLERDGLVRLDGAHRLVPTAGRRFVRQVAACFDAYWQPAAQRHSAAV